jgi:hypothetical protein
MVQNGHICYAKQQNSEYAKYRVIKNSEILTSIEERKKGFVWCPGQNKRIAPLSSSMDLVKGD